MESKQAIINEDLHPYMLMPWAANTGREFIRTPDIHNISIMCCDTFGIDISELNYNVRNPDIVECRQIIYFFSIALTRHSLVRIGEKIGNRGHATVIHGQKVVVNYYDTEPEFRDMIQGLALELGMNLESLEEYICKIKQNRSHKRQTQFCSTYSLTA